jgi:hypothetical protein
LRLWQLTNTIWPALLATVLLEVGFSSGVGVGVGRTCDSGGTVGDRFELVALGFGVRLAATADVGLLTGALPGFGRLQARIIKTIPKIQMAIFFMMFLSYGVDQDWASLLARPRSPR